MNKEFSDKDVVPTEQKKWETPTLESLNIDEITQGGPPGSMGDGAFTS